ncbi:PAS domain S-box protein [Roseomonas indoligenes]|uniref:histidine kinase n=1 Tax=Roseomonas indoligenes TaxID=2820811 RepID=A0A940N3X2_9PROT|nr:PAS domain S-box protein [Pararoseomonas indoligenes]MBP0493747.1 PAS domain S-box protein [Pararoseomonas indoligenes]
MADPDLSGSVGALSAAVLGAALEMAGLAVIITDAALDRPGPVIRYANAHMEAVTGYTAAELIGRSPRILQGPKTSRTELDRLRRALQAERHFVGSTFNYRKDGTLYLNEWVVTAILGPDGEVTHWLSIQRDVTAEGRNHPGAEELRRRTESILSTLRQIAARSPAPPEGQALEDRLAALGRAQGETALDSLLRAELAPWPARAVLDGPPVTLGPGLAGPLALALHELAAHAARRGALATPAGRLAVRWHVEDSRLVIAWEESGVPDPDDSVLRSGYARQVLEEALAFALGGETRLERRPDGLACRISVPLEG